MARHLALFVLAMSAPVFASEPRFALEPGLELRYVVKLGNWSDGKDGKPEIPREADGSPKYQISDLTIYVLGRQPAGSFRVFMHGTSLAGSPLLTWADLFPDGHITIIPLAAPFLEFDTLRTIFPLLPKDEKERRSGWKEVDPITDLRMRFIASRNAIKAECESPLDRVSQGRWSITYELDATTHLPNKVLTEGRWEKYKETHSTKVEAKETLRHDEKWVANFTANASKYFEAVANEKRAHLQGLAALAIAEREKPGAAMKALEARNAKLKTTRDAVIEPIFRAHLDRLIKQNEEYLETRVETAKRWAKVAGLNAPAWKVADLTGKEHSLAQYRGQVVVLDFWFRQCSFCIRAMPQVEQTAATFRQEKAPVSFFAISIDKDEADARHVADTMKLTYPVLRSEKVANELGITSYPTLLIIAPDGTIQGIFVGYSLTLREDLTACVRGLLKK